MNYTQAQNDALTKRFNSMSPEMFQGYINNPRTGSQLKAWMQANNYQHPGMMQSSAVPPAVSAPVTSNLGMSENHIGSYGPNKPSYLHLDQAKHSGKSIPLSEYGNRPEGGSIPFSQSTAGQGVSIPFNEANTIDTMNKLASNPNYGQFYSQMRNNYNVANTSLPVGSSGMPSVDLASQSASEQAVAESIAKSGTESAGASGLTGPQAFFANMALEAIPTRDRNKVNTPFGDQGSVPGILKGAGKGALLGSTIDTATGGATGGLGTIGGAIIGGVSGAQGTFDSTSPRQVISSSIRRPRGGLLQVPKGLYG